MIMRRDRKNSYCLISRRVYRRRMQQKSSDIQNITANKKKKNGKICSLLGNKTRNNGIK